MKSWVMGLVLLLVALGLGLLGGALLFPRKVVVVRELPAVVQTHTITQTDSGPYAILSDSIAKLLVKLHVPVPPRPTPQQPQLIYGLSFIGKKLTLSVVQGASPRYKEESWTDVDENFYVAWRDTGAYWDVTSWTSPQEGAVVVSTTTPKRWSAWRPTIEAGIAWFPGQAAEVFASPGVLVLGHLKVGVIGRVALIDLTQKAWSRLSIGVGASLNW
jgi:hypothetical protein